ncbi:MAG: DUF3087 family protein [Rheinheimera sp.]|nr:MAG: DUF3087 family protein [Rheinheimera sp.]
MQLTDIDKNTYRSHLNVVIVCAVAVFSALGVGISAALVYWFGAEQGQNFYLNLLGVCTGGAISAWCLNRLKSTRYFYEVAYVWDLKQELNLINRKLASLKKAVAAQDPDAMLVMLYNLQGSKQLWQLDDNLLNLQELELELIQLEHKIRACGLMLDASQYHRRLLDKF